MVIIELSGGLGNQMFEYATARALALARNEDLMLDLVDFDQSSTWNFGLDQFTLDPQVQTYKSSAWFRKVRRYLANKGLALVDRGVHRERGLRFDQQLRDRRSVSRLIGYFQSEDYFKDQREMILREFTPRNELGLDAREVLRRIEVSPCPVSLHVRRGDYLNVKVSGVHTALSPEYYQKAEDHLLRHGIQPEFYVFSDDLEWCRNNLALRSKIVFPKADSKTRNIEDLWLMSRCRHQVIANSSFSWWGAWLSSHPDQVVIAPSRWFGSTTHDSQDIIPRHWITI